MKQGWNGIRRRLGPVGLSLAAAAITAASFAAFSLAADDNKGGSGDTAAAPGPPGGPGMIFRAELSQEDREQMESFRKCMEDQGMPAPPRFREGEAPPEPPSREEMEQLRDKLEVAHEACKDELPSELRDRGLPPMGAPGPCGPPPGAENRDDGNGGNEGDDGEEGENQDQTFEFPVPPAPSGTS